jgi:hypothetical protein
MLTKGDKNQIDHPTRDTPKLGILAEGNRSQSQPPTATNRKQYGTNGLDASFLSCVIAIRECPTSDENNKYHRTDAVNARALVLVVPKLHLGTRNE